MKYLLLIPLIIVVISCQKEDYSWNTTEDLKAELKLHHPNIRSVTWEVRGFYNVASFKEDGKSKRAWFSRDAYWYMTETESHLSNIPSEVLQSFLEGEYSEYEVREVIHIDRSRISDEYIITVKRGVVSVELFYSSCGKLIKTLDEEDRYFPDNRDEVPHIIPERVYSYLEKYHTKSTIVDIDILFPGYPVTTLIEGDSFTIVNFTQTGEHYKTIYEVWL